MKNSYVMTEVDYDGNPRIVGGTVDIGAYEWRPSVPAGVEGVVVQPRYPWSGDVDISFTITGDAGTAYQVSFAAKDMAGGTNLVMKTVMFESGGPIEVALPPGTYRAVWNAGADLPDGFKAERVAITVEAK